MWHFEEKLKIVNVAYYLITRGTHWYPLASIVGLFIIPPPPPPLLGRGGTSRFTSVSRDSASVCVCARLYLGDISNSFLLMTFKLLDVVTIDKTLN